MTTSPRALIVDDNALNSRLVAVHLKRLGWTSDVAASGEEALAYLRAQSAQMVLLDLRMPVMSGEQVCRAIRHDLKLTDLPVIAYTAHGMPEEKARMLANGFTGLLIKPISFGDVRQLVSEITRAVAR